MVVAAWDGAQVVCCAIGNISAAALEASLPLIATLYHAAEHTAQGLYGDGNSRIVYLGDAFILRIIPIQGLADYMGTSRRKVRCPCGLSNC